jgi:hypothetical protein
MTPETAEREISGQLESGERLLWSGIPPQGLLLRGSDAFLIPFSFMWGGFAIFWETSVLKSGAPLFFALWGVPFVLVGLYLIAGRFVVEAKQRTRMAYGVTDRRAVIISGLFSKNVKSLALKTLTEVTLTERPDGTGTITFGPSHPMARWYGNTAWPGMGAYSSPCFESIRQARDVYATIRESQVTH